MKKVSAFFAALFLTFSVPTIPVVPAQMTALGPVAVTAPASVPMPVAVVSPTLDRIGVVAAAGGKVGLTTPGQAGRIAQSAQPIFMGDEVKTDADGHLQILLLDETVFTIGPNSTIIIDKFVYDPKSHNGEIKASVTKGVFRYVSGKIAAKNPNSVKMKLPTATLGFRGTIVGGSVGGNGQGLVGLMGPGSNNDAGAQNGSFSIDGTGGGHQDVNRTGFGVEVGADGGLSGVFQLSNDQINGLTGGLGGGQGGGGGSGGGAGSGGSGAGGGLGGNTDMGGLSGENNALAGGNGGFSEGLSNFSSGLDAASVLGAQEGRNASGGVTGTVADGVTTVAELDTVTSGSFNYSCSGAFALAKDMGSPVAYVGTVTADISIDFAAKTLSGLVQISVSQTELSQSVSISKTFSDGLGGLAIFSGTSSGLTATISLLNQNGIVADQAVVSASYAAGSPGYETEGAGGAVGNREPAVVIEG